MDIKKRMIEVAQELKELCTKMDGCDNCPFVGDDFECYLKENFPDRWIFETPE